MTTQTETSPIVSVRELANISLARTPTAKALQLMEQGKIRRTTNGFLVIGSRGLTWEIKVINGKVTCECEGFRFRDQCYHAKAIEILEHGVKP